MQDKEKGGLEKLSVKNTLKLAMEQEPSKHLRGGLYGNMDDKKSQILSGIIADGMMDLMEASGRPQVKKNDLEAIRERTMEYIQNRRASASHGGRMGCFYGHYPGSLV